MVFVRPLTLQSAVSGSSGVGPGGAAATASPSTLIGASRKMTSTGQTPAAKRPATLIATTGAAGPAMSAADANAFMYALHYKIEAAEKWAFTVNESITDHAEHIHTTRASR